MSARLVEEVLDHYHGPVARKLWLLAFARYARDDTRAAWAPQEKLGVVLGLSVRHVRRIAAELTDEGVIKRDGGGFGRTPVRYVLMPLGGLAPPEPNGHRGRT